MLLLRAINFYWQPGFMPTQVTLMGTVLRATTRVLIPSQASSESLTYRGSMMRGEQKITNSFFILALALFGMEAACAHQVLWRSRNTQ